MKILSQQSLLQILLLPGEEQTIVTGERLVAPLALLPTVLLLLLVGSLLASPFLFLVRVGMARSPDGRQERSNFLAMSSFGGL